MSVDDVGPSSPLAMMRAERRRKVIIAAIGGRRVALRIVHLVRHIHCGAECEYDNGSRCRDS